MVLTMMSSMLFLNICMFSMFGLVGGLETEESVRINTLEATVQQLQASLNQVKTQLANLDTQPVASTAMLKNSIDNLGSNQIVVFEHVATNVGNGYNNLDGHFTAPVDGTYVFFVTITSLPYHSASLHLMRNGQDTGARVLANGLPTDNGSYHSATVATTLYLNAGDRVWAQNKEQYSNIEQLDGAYWSSFSGHLVK